MKTILAHSLHICDYVAVGSLYSITLLMLNLSEMPGLNSLVKVSYYSYVSVGHCMVHLYFCLTCDVSIFSLLPFG
jgi:hypothetical protein